MRLIGGVRFRVSTLFVVMTAISATLWFNLRPHLSFFGPDSQTYFGFAYFLHQGITFLNQPGRRRHSAVARQSTAYCR